MKRFIVAAAACSLLAGCATDPGAGSDNLAQQEGYAPTGTFIKRKNGEGLGPTSIGTVRKQDVENARAMNSSGQGARNGF